MLVKKLIAVCILATVSRAQLNYNNPIYVPEYVQTQSSYVGAVQQPPAEIIKTAPALDSTLNIQQLPTPNAPQPFFTLDPMTVLKAPTEEALLVNFNTQSYPPVPSQNLELPSLIKWNPDNDPNLYYPVVEKVAPANIPTALYPKKYNKGSRKVKPNNFKVKESVSKTDSPGEQKKSDKLLHVLAKQENKKMLELEKLALVESKNQKVNDPVPAESIFSGFSKHDSGSHGGLAHTGVHGISDHDGERMEFQIAGHDGPKSYKWGFDTGKGHNRQIRYEERDKHGFVKGHYGYFDKNGKLRMVHYDSHPHEGFHAEDGNSGQY